MRTKLLAWILLTLIAAPSGFPMCRDVNDRRPDESPSLLSESARCAGVACTCVMVLVKHSAIVLPKSVLRGTVRVLGRTDRAAKAIVQSFRRITESARQLPETLSTYSAELTRNACSSFLARIWAMWRS